MANTQSAELAFLEASPRGIADRRLVASANLKTKGNVEFTPTTAADTLQIARVPVDATLESLKFGFDDFGTGITFDIGFYKVGAPGAVVDQNALATAVDVAAATLPSAADLVLFGLTELRYETHGIVTTGERMWELANLAARPSYEEIDIVITVLGDTTPVIGTVAWIIEFTR